MAWGGIAVSATPPYNHDYYKIIPRSAIWSTTVDIIVNSVCRKVNILILPSGNIKKCSKTRQITTIQIMCLHRRPNHNYLSLATKVLFNLKLLWVRGDTGQIIAVMCLSLFGAFAHSQLTGCTVQHRVRRLPGTHHKSHQTTQTSAAKGPKVIRSPNQINK